MLMCGATYCNIAGVQCSKADLYDKVFVGNLAGMGVQQQLTGCQHSPSACRILPAM